MAIRALGTPVDLRASVPDPTKVNPYEYDEAIRRRLGAISSQGKQQTAYAQQKAVKDQEARYAALLKQMNSNLQAQANQPLNINVASPPKAGATPAGKWTSPIAGMQPTYGYGRAHSKTGTHKGIDFATRVGTNVQAVRGGTVYEAGWNNTGYGNNIRVDYGDGTYGLFGHLSGFNVKVGDVITQGQIIGKSGNTGYSTGPHLHYQWYTNKNNAAGSALDPTKYFGW